jgi:hypothetical protein
MDFSSSLQCWLLVKSELTSIINLICRNSGFCDSAGFALISQLWWMSAKPDPCDGQMNIKRDFRLPPQCKWNLLSSRMLRSVEWLSTFRDKQSKKTCTAWPLKTRRVGCPEISVTNEALLYKPAGRGFDPRWCYWIFHWHNPVGRTLASGSTQPLTEMSTRNISWGGGGGKWGLCVWLTTCHLHVPIV